MTTEPSFESLCRRAFAAYEYLRDADLTGFSSTAKRLRSSDSGSLWHRLGEELEELSGVLGYTHHHTDFESDLLLEAYEVFYWACCTAVALGLPYARLLPHRFMHDDYATGSPAQQPHVAMALHELGIQAEKYAHGQGGMTEIHLVGNLIKVFRLVGMACACSQGTPLVTPERVVGRDLAEMAAKPYLAEFFAQHTGEPLAQG